MPEPDPSSPWSRTGHGTAPVEPPAAQPSHAWLSSEAYASVQPPAGAYAAALPSMAPLPMAPLPMAPMPPVEVHVAAPSGGRGLAILGVVLGGLALLCSGVPFLMLLAFGLMDDEPGGGGYYGPVRGTIAPATGQALSGQALAEEVTTKLSDQGNEPENVSCPETASVAQDVTTVCHGTDFGDDAAFVVFFEDAKGSYTLLEI